MQHWGQRYQEPESPESLIAVAAIERPEQDEQADPRDPHRPAQPPVDMKHVRGRQGVGENGHDPEVLYQLLLLIRNIFVLEEGEFLDFLPGIFTSGFWEQPQIKVTRLTTYFGEITFNCDTIGDLIQIEFWPQYRVKPEKVRLFLQQSFRVVYVDAESKNHDFIL